VGILKGGATLDRDSIYPHGFQAKFRTIRVVLRETGPVPFLTKVLPWSFCRSYVLYSEIIRVHDAYMPPYGPFRFRLAGKEDISSIMELRKGYYTRKLLEKRLDMGHQCYLGWNSEELVHSRWTFAGSFRVPYFHKQVVLMPNEVFGDESYTAPGYRRLGFSFQSGRFLRLTIQKMGFERLTVAIASWNTPARRAALKSGMAETARFGYWNGPGTRKFFWSGDIEVQDDGTIIFKAVR
jgi:hypothetical protein